MAGDAGALWRGPVGGDLDRRLRGASTSGLGGRDGIVGEGAAGDDIFAEGSAGEAMREVTEAAAETGACSDTEGILGAGSGTGAADAFSICTSPSPSILGSVGSAAGAATRGGGVCSRSGPIGALGDGSTCLFGGGVWVGDRVRERERLGGEGVRFRGGGGLRLRTGGAGEYDPRRGERRSRRSLSR